MDPLAGLLQLGMRKRKRERREKRISLEALCTNNGKNAPVRRNGGNTSTNKRNSLRPKISIFYLKRVFGDLCSPKYVLSSF